MPRKAVAPTSKFLHVRLDHNSGSAVCVGSNLAWNILITSVQTRQQRWAITWLSFDPSIKIPYSFRGCGFLTSNAPLLELPIVVVLGNDTWPWDSQTTLWNSLSYRVNTTRCYLYDCTTYWTCYGSSQLSSLLRQAPAEKFCWVSWYPHPNDEKLPAITKGHHQPEGIQVVLKIGWCVRKIWGCWPLTTRWISYERETGCTSSFLANTVDQTLWFVWLRWESLDDGASNCLEPYQQSRVRQAHSHRHWRASHAED